MIDGRPFLDGIRCWYFVLLGPYEICKHFHHFSGDPIPLSETLLLPTDEPLYLLIVYSHRKCGKADAQFPPVEIDGLLRIVQPPHQLLTILWLQLLFLSFYLPT